MWEIAMVYLPAAACVLVSIPFTRLPAAAAAPSAGASRRRRAIALGLVGAAFVLAVALDRLASARIHRLDADALLRELEPWNPGLGEFLVRSGDEALERGKEEEAIAIFRLALRYESSAAAATKGLRRAHERAETGAGATP
jgi:hypothetical protein